MDALSKQINDHEDMGSRAAYLGIQEMPSGYALMQDFDGYYYWLRHDGKQSAIHWDRWIVYAWAWAKSKTSS